MDELLAGLRAAAEPTRLRLLALCAESELTVSELTQILGQSQPRVSRHLKLMCEAGLLERFREGSWAFFRIAEAARGQGGDGQILARALVALLPADDDQLTLDRARLADVRAERAAQARAYFGRNAADWDRIRRMHVDEAEVEDAILDRIGDREITDVLDIGTGTGRVLALIAPRAERALGIDASREMLAVARANLDRAGLRHASVRQGDLHQLPLLPASFDLVTMHQVLHYLDAPGRAIGEAARVLRPGGRLVLVDFAPHDREELRDAHAHRRLGFRDGEIAEWLEAAGLVVEPARHLPGGPLTVVIWSGSQPGRDPAGAENDAASGAGQRRNAPEREVA